MCTRQNSRKNDGIDAKDYPEIIFSDHTQSVVIDGHHLDVEIYRTSIDPGWILSVENQFGTLTVSDNPPFFGDVLAWRAFEELVREEGITAFYNKKERRKLGI
ncbi:hypothetical protein [Sulfitobacter sediminilitoris]|uniref:hypothetical protein n=1 Tax=Sulfitobacter sediminilitoris TaxID=2698830 RepID=UPI001954BABA